jgi:PPOX class probable F420-dependent enzyme
MEIVTRSAWQGSAAGGTRLSGRAGDGQDEHMMTLADAAEVGSRDRYLAVVSTVRADGTVQSSVVNAGVLADPDSGADVVAFVTYGKAKLTNLRARPQATITFRAGWQWAAIEGTARIVGPDDPAPGTDAERLRLLRREVFTAAGGSHDDWAEYDRVMAAERRAVVLVTPARVYSNARVSG